MEIKEYYEDLLEMFSKPGWKHFMEDMERDRRNLSSIEGVSDYESFHYRKGQLQVVTTILNYEELARQGLEQLDEDNS